MISKEKLDDLCRELKRGSKAKIADDTGYSRGYVSDVLAGRYYNEDVIEAAIQLRDLQREKQKELEGKI